MNPEVVEREGMDARFYDCHVCGRQHSVLYCRDKAEVELKRLRRIERLARDAVEGQRRGETPDEQIRRNVTATRKLVRQLERDLVGA